MHLLTLYFRLIAVEIRAQWQYRTAFALDLMGSALNSGLWVATIGVLFTRFDQLGDWSFYEVAFLFGLIETSFGTMDLLFSGFDPSYFGQHVRRGTFDQFLLRPAPLVVQILGARFILRRLGRIAQGVFVLIFALRALPIVWTAGKLLYLPLLCISQVLFFGGLFIAGAALTFWSVESVEVINIFTYGGSEMMSYPMHIYQENVRQFFTYIVPAIFLNYYPALYFLDRPDPLGFPAYAPFIAPFVALAVLAVGLACFRHGVHHYQGTGN